MTELSPTQQRVLIVDDEPAIARTLALIFAKAGYDARSALSAEEALAIFRSGTWLPDLAILDVYLPHMSGIDLAILLQAEFPACRLTLFSGQTTASDLLDIARSNGYDFEIIPKPVMPATLLNWAEGLPPVTDKPKSEDPPNRWN